MGEVEGLLAGRYQIACEMGRSSQGTTWLATDAQSGRKVTLRQIPLAGLKDWKQVDLLQRESTVLKRLSHPGIAAYVDDFVIEQGPMLGFYLVKEHVRGSTLEHLLDGPSRLPLARALEITRELLVVLRYLHEVDPPVVHRDIKPANIVIRDDGSVVLIDFGILREGVAGSGSTIAGTSGYMAPEQALGRAMPQTDLFAVGMVLIHMLSHTHPSKLSFHRGRVDFANHTKAPPTIMQLARALASPNVEDRPFSAREALALLEKLVEHAGPRPVVSGAPTPVQTPDAPQASTQPMHRDELGGLLRAPLALVAIAAGLVSAAPVAFTMPNTHVARAQAQRNERREVAQLKKDVRAMLTEQVKLCNDADEMMEVEILVIWEPDSTVCRVVEAPQTLDGECLQNAMEARLGSISAAPLTAISVGVLP